MAFWSGKRVLITGISGFIGRWLASRLLEENAEVSGVDSGGWIASVWPTKLEADLIPGDIRDPGLMRKALAGKEVVFHLAAISGVEHSRRLGQVAFDINVNGTLAVLGAANSQKEKPLVIVATSNHVYGPQKSYPVAEDAPLNQLDTYSASKICADVLTRAYWHNYHLPTAAVRNTNCFGPYDPHTGHIIPGTMSSIVKGERPVVRSHGKTRKAYLHVGDVVSAYMLIAELVAQGKAGEAWNVSTDSISVLELVKTIAYLLDYKEEPRILGECNDQADEDMDWSKLWRFGWAPKWSLEAALLDTAEWLRNVRRCESIPSRS